MRTSFPFPMRRPAVVLAATVCLVAVGASATQALLSGDRMQNALSRYQHEIRVLRTKLDRAESRAAVQQAALARKAAALDRRERWLSTALPEAEAVRTVDLGLRLGGKGDVLGAVERSLRKAERRQLGDVAMLGARARTMADRLTKILKLHGVHTPGRDTGGPLIELKGSDAFDAKLAAFEAEHERLDELRDRARHVPQGSPVPGRRISSRFGARRDPINRRQAMHAGLDFAAPKGEPVRATASGTVKSAARRGGYGKLIVIDHGNGMSTRYGHLSRMSVRKGQRVERGDVIGRVGSTGRSTGPHLHYEVRRKGQVRDPSHYVRLERALKPLM